MSEEKESVSSMLRTVINNNATFLNAIADRIDEMETYITTLHAQITELNTKLEEKCNDENT